MNDAIKAILKTYGKLENQQQEINALKEIIQLITLRGMHRGGFFEQGCFYGGTALRILYGLDRFSEDLDFCLCEPNSLFTLEPYFHAIKDELERFGFSPVMQEKKSNKQTAIESAFVKLNTNLGLIVIGKSNKKLSKNQLVKIKIEVDTSNPKGFKKSEKLVKLPSPFLISTLSEDSLFAGKLHALLARNYLSRVKGRDYYDFLFYMSRDTPINLHYLESKLRDSGHYQDPDSLTLDVIKNMLIKKFNEIDFGKVKADILPFITQNKESDVKSWNANLFIAITEHLTSSDDCVSLN